MLSSLSGDGVTESGHQMDKPVIGIDMDGVICTPPLGINLAIGRGPYPGTRVEAPTGGAVRCSDHGMLSWPRAVFQRLKYVGRRPLADAKEGLLAIRERRTLVLVTSRNGLVHSLVESWLARYGLLEMFEAVHTNHTGLPSPEFKWYTVLKLGIEEFVDDDGRVADFLSRKGVERIYLRDWPRNRGYEYAESVVRVRGLLEVAEELKRLHA